MGPGVLLPLLPPPLLLLLLLLLLVPSCGLGSGPAPDFLLLGLRIAFVKRMEEKMMNKGKRENVLNLVRFEN